MPPEDDDDISTLKKHSAAQTLLQVGMLAELEAHRRELNRQGDLLQEGVQHAKLQAIRVQLEKQELAIWRETLVEVEVAARGAPLGALAELLRNEDAISQAPEEASVDERRLAKTLLLSKSERYARLRDEAPAELDLLDKWYASRVAATISSLQKLCEAIGRASDGPYFVGAIAQAADVDSATTLLAEAKALSDGVFENASRLAAELNSALNELSPDQRIVAVDHLPALKYALDSVNYHLGDDKRQAMEDKWSEADAVLRLFTKFRDKLQIAETAGDHIDQEELAAIEGFHQKLAVVSPEESRLYAALAQELAALLPVARERRRRMDEKTGCGCCLLILIGGTIIAYFIYAASV